MSQLIFPTRLPGMKMDLTRAPRFKTHIQSAVSGRETRAAFMGFPLWDLTVSFEFLQSGNRGSDLSQLVALFGQVKGSWDSFLLPVPDDNAVTDHLIATGNGSTRNFQLMRSITSSGFVLTEPVMNVNSITNVKVNGVAVTGYTVSATGVLTLPVTPASGASITWTGSYYFRCRFTNDTVDFNRFMADLYELKALKMIGAPGNRV